MRDILVPWSGGFDSTYLVQHLLESNPDNRVSTFYINLQNNTEKTEMEKHATTTMAPMFTSAFPGRFTHFGTRFEFNVWGGCNLQLKQPLLWLTACTYVGSKSFHEVALGYVMGDCAISFLDDFRNIWNSFKPLSCQPFPVLTFPLAKSDKEDVHANLRSDFYKHCATCEHPTKVSDGIFTPCGKCVPCKRNQEARPKLTLTEDHYQI